MKHNFPLLRRCLPLLPVVLLAASVNVAATQVTAIGANAKQHAQATPEQVRAAIEAAEQRRLAAMAPDPAVPAEVVTRWGVQVLGVSYAADGFWLEFRVRVTDRAKARASGLFDNKVKPYLAVAGEPYQFGVAEASQVGSLRTTDRGNGFNIQRGRIYSMMFSNPGFHVQPGQKVTVGAGDFKVKGLTVHGAHRYLHVKQAKNQE